MKRVSGLFVGHDGHFNGYEPLICADDAAAIEEAKRLPGTLVPSFGAVSDWSRD
jgi:hypothetical protein